jgi:thioester reductase-like protein
MRHVLLTGYPTFTARYLLGELVDNEPDTVVHCIVTQDLMERARAHAETLAAGDRIQLMAGDVCALDLGLTGKQYLDVCQKVTAVYHLAAVWDTSADRSRLHRVNVRGTENVVLCARDMSKLTRFNHMSTAFVAGDRVGVIMEEEFDEQQSHRNPYETSQFEAEKIVRRLMTSHPVTIFRPSLIVGHSVTGQIDRATGPYALIRPLVNLPRNVPMPMPGRGEAPLNMVPVDYVAGAIRAISLRPEAAGRTFHLVDPNPVSGRRVFELVAMAAGRPLPRGHVPAGVTRLITHLPGIERALRTGLQVFDDFNSWAVFNSLNTAELTRSGPWCPSFPAIVEPMVEHLRESA